MKSRAIVSVQSVALFSSRSIADGMRGFGMSRQTLNVWSISCAVVRDNRHTDPTVVSVARERVMDTVGITDRL